MKYTEDQLRQVAADICEDWDVVQILVSKTEDGVTTMFSTGAGNFYARLGMSQAFVKRDLCQEIGHAIDQNS